MTRTRGLCLREVALSLLLSPALPPPLIAAAAVSGTETPSPIAPRVSYSNSSKTDRDELLKIQQERKEVFKIRQERER